MFLKVKSIKIVISAVALIALCGCGESPVISNNSGSEDSNLPSNNGAYYTGIYPSAASLPGAQFTQMQADAKMAEAWAIFKAELVTSDGAVVHTDANDVVSEGQSYGMMLAVQNNDQATFDKIWNWTRTYMQASQPQGLFAWKCSLDGTVLDQDYAPDAEEMIAMALFFASHRWGDKASPYNYSAQARVILSRMLTQANPSDAPITSDNYIKFTATESNWFNPSYCMPAFHRLFALYTNETRWNSVASNSYVLINNCLKSGYGNTTNGLVPDYCKKDGSLLSSGTTFGYDAMRTPYFVALDQVWFGADTRSQVYLDKIIGSFFSSRYDSFGDGYILDGTKIGSSYTTGWLGSFTGGAMGGSSDADKVKFFNYLMNQDFATGQYRYYNIAWHNFGLLLASGNFKIY
ncbi:MAG: glycosyl hydrolase family 8 [bacterium]